VDSRSRAVEVAKEREVWAKLSSLAENVSGDDGRAKKGARIDHLGITKLMRKHQHSDRSSFGLNEIHCAVANLVQSATSPLQIVTSVEIVSADNTIAHAGNGVEVGVVVDR
jgi:hypothetical protein